MAKVIIIASLASSLTRFRGDLIEAMQRRGHEVIAIAPTPDSDTQSRLASRGVKVLSCKLQRASIDPLGDLRYAAELSRAIGDVRPQVVLAYTPKPVIYGGTVCRGFPGVKFFALITGLGYGFGRETLRQRLLTPVLSAMYRFGLNRSHAAIFQNPDDEELFTTRRIVSRDKSIVVPGSGVNTAHFSPTPLPDSPVFLLMARLIPEKGVREYVSASRLVRRAVPEARFLLAGWLESRKGAIASSELDSWQREGLVEYLGVLDDVRPAINRAAVYVLPSYYREGVPRSVLEAMAMGRPIITTDLPGCRETVRAGENGILVRPRDSEDLANAMLQMATSPTRRSVMGQASRSFAMNQFAMEHVNGVMLQCMGL